MNKIFFDVTFLQFGADKRGIPQVILQLVRLFVIRSDFSNVVFITTEKVATEILVPMGISRQRMVMPRTLPLLGRFERFHGVFSTWRYAKVLKDAQWVIHPELRTVVRGSVHQIIIFHDFIIFSDESIQGRRKWTRNLLFTYKHSVAAKVDYWITNSEATRKEALSRFPARKPESVRTLHLGSRLAFTNGPRELPKDGDLLEFLFVGAYDPRKNLVQLLQNFPGMLGKRKARMVLIGKMSELNREALNTLSNDWPQHLTLKIKGLVDDSDLVNAYKTANFLLFPSLREGFGLPLVEAMAQGLVVFAFRNSTIPEITQDSAVLAIDNDFKAWTYELTQLLENRNQYQDLSQKALIRAKEFSEEQMFARYGDFFFETCINQTDTRG